MELETIVANDVELKALRSELKEVASTEEMVNGRRESIESWRSRD